MKHEIFSIYDEKSCSYGTPFFAVTRAHAMRSFEDVSKDSQSMISKHPADFGLYCLGDFSPVGGKIVGFVEPVFLVRATDFKREIFDLGKPSITKE